MIEKGQLDFEASLVPGSAKQFMKDAGASSRDLWQIDIDKIQVLPDFNVRIQDEAYWAHIRELADSMKTEGFYQHKPLAGYVVKKDGEQITYVTDGHCRLAGVKLAVKEGAEIAKVPIVIASAGSNMEDLLVELVRGNSGKPLGYIETAMVCKRLARFGWDSKEIARRLGYSETHIEGYLLLISAPAAIRDMVVAGTVSGSVATAALREHGGKALERLQEGLTLAQARGKTKVSNKHIRTAPVFKKEIKRAGTSLFMALREVHEDPAYGTISQSLRSKVESLLAHLGSLDGAVDAVASETKKAEKAAAPAKTPRPAKTTKPKTIKSQVAPKSKVSSKQASRQRQAAH